MWHGFGVVGVLDEAISKSLYVRVDCRVGEADLGSTVLERDQLATASVDGAVAQPVGQLLCIGAAPVVSTIKHQDPSLLDPWNWIDV